MPKWPVPVFYCFWFQENRKANILRIGKGNYFTKFYTGRLQKPEGEQQGGHRGPTPGPGAPPLVGRAWPRCGPPRPPPTPPLRLFNPPGWKTLNIARKVQKEVRSRRHRHGEICALPGTLPEGRLSPEAFFITMPTSGVMFE